jgi:peptidase M1-like protein
VREWVLRARWVRAALRLGLALLAARCAAQAAPPEAPAQALYRRLSSVGLDVAQVYNVRDAALDREDLHLSFDDGTLAFTQAVDGRITGAYFEGHGEVLLTPPGLPDRTSMTLFTGAPILDEEFTSAYLRFNDDTPQQLQPALQRLQGDDARQFVERSDAAVRLLAESDALRLLVGFTGSSGAGQGRMLHVHLSGTHLGIFTINLDAGSPEQLSVGQVTSEGGTAYYDLWASFPMRSARAAAGAPGDPAAPEERAALRITSYRIVAHVLPPHDLAAEAQLDLEVRRGGERTLVFELSRNLKVSSVTADGRPLEVIQNEALEGSQLARRGNDLVAVVFPQPVAAGQRIALRFAYAGSVLSEAGGGLMYVGARGAWYPNLGPSMANFDLEFHYPKDWTLLATGTRTSHGESGGEQVAHWVADKPIPLAGFNLGQYARASARTGGVTIQAFAAPGPPVRAPAQDVVVIPRWFPGPRQQPENPVVLPPPDPAAKAEAVAQQSAQLVEFLSPRLGPFPYSSLALTEIPGSSSQGWPGLVFLSHYVYAATKGGVHGGDEFDSILYGSLMGWHETAHEWWGDAVLWKSYRDQWLVEALANYSALMLLERKRPGDFRVAMEHYRQGLLRNGPHNKRYLEAGPVTLGVRLDSFYFPDGYDVVGYGRGTWLLHMLRYLLREQAEETAAKPGVAESDPDAAFFRVLRTLRERHEGKSMSTADVQQAFEEALPPSASYEGRRSLDWFFQQWVNGTAVPRLKLSNVRITRGPGKGVVTGAILQEDAPETLVTCVPVYADTGGARPVWLGRVFADGPETSFRFAVPPGTKKILLDPYQTVLTRP